VTGNHAEALIDVRAVGSNVAELARRAAPAEVLAVVKADAYGHGLLPCAQAAVAAGATWLGTALLDEALALRAAGLVRPRILAWLLSPDTDWAAAVTADIDVSASAPWAITAAAEGARVAGRPARLHLKVDSGLGRAGSPEAGWEELLSVASKAEADGLVDVVGVWSHLAYADSPHHPTIDAQLGNFRAALDQAEQAGLRPEVRHLANSAATLSRPDTHFDLVRPGLATYGLSPLPELAGPAELGLRPAMTVVARLALVKRVPAGQGVSYQHRYTTSRETTLGLVPLGYADGVPRQATNLGPLLAGGALRTIAGTVCMDQFVVDLEDAPANAGDEVILFGPGDQGEPSAQDWADACGTISYEIVTRIGPRVPRIIVGAQ
jgi:alanine racemase